MASTFSPSLRLELIGEGDQSGIWGQSTNNNIGTLIEQAISGVVTINMANTNYTLINFNGVSDEARNQVIVLTGANSAQRNLIAPLVEKTYVIRNSTTGGFAVQVIGASGTGVVIPNGVTTTVYCDGTNFFSAISGVAGNFTVSGNAVVSGSITGTTAAFSGAISSVSPAFTGTPTAPTAAPGTNTTQIATTAFVAAVPTFPSGGIIMWSGSIASIPSGWLLCNGSSGTPDLRDRFIVGAGSTYAVAATGGSANAVVVSHTHTATSTDSGHTHPFTASVNGATGYWAGAGAFQGYSGSQTPSASTTSSGTANVTTTVASSGVSGTNANLPPYYALAYIMKS